MSQHGILQPNERLLMFHIRGLHVSILPCKHRTFEVYFSLVSVGKRPYPACQSVSSMTLIDKQRDFSIMSLDVD